MAGREAPRFARLSWLAAWVAFFHGVSAGCNGLLGNEEGHLGKAPALVTDAADDVATGIDQVAPPADAAGEASISCPFGKKPCAGGCVDRTDWQVGCGLDSCDPCGAEHASFVKCLPKDNVLVCTPTCEPGWAECDGDPANGCEADLSKPEHCGACATVCGGATSLCKTQGSNSFACAAGCDLGTTQCGNQCPDTKTNIQHCGGCDKACTAPANATPKCTDSKCSFQCNFGYHLCGGVCVPNGEVTKCGVDCRDCTTTAPAHAVAKACTDNHCVFGCAPTSAGSDWNDCNNDLQLAGSNGCETNGWNNNVHCGSCNNSCSPSLGSGDGGTATGDGGASLGDGGTTPLPAGTFCCHESCVVDGTICN